MRPQTRRLSGNRKVVQWLAVKNLKSEADGVEAAQWSDADGFGADMDSSSWLFAALNNPRGQAGFLFVDSGADDHMCHPDFAKEFQFKKSAGLRLRDVQGNPLSHHGTRHVNLSVERRGQRANIDFQIADISDNILSLEKLLRNGFVFNIRRKTDLIMYHQLYPTTIVPLFLHKDMPLRLSVQSPLRLMYRRLDELALPKHSTKSITWTRLEKRENELMRERTSQAAIEAEREAGRRSCDPDLRPT